ncbi:hypothetical protein [Massilia rubra]|uniref:DUF4190 domain-containing protein n=1 Tax=Massilia rubra TaxID=2607910 RepID=A0ABX0LR57_9BURK|nr:hypothetical protein [Massilia rubra]NHZ36474.1 hypothetical protein [Massilia rubra]
MSRKKRPLAPPRAWVPFGATSVLSLLVGEAIWIWEFGTLLVVGAGLALVCTAMGIDLLRKHGARPLHVTAVVIGLAIGQFRMIEICLMILAWSARV